MEDNINVNNLMTGLDVAEMPVETQRSEKAEFQKVCFFKKIKFG